MKTCTACSTAKDCGDFHKDKSRADGLRSVCKSCASAKAMEWIGRNSEQHALRMADYYRANQDRLRLASRTWQAKRKDLKQASVARRRAARLRAVPSWFGELDELVFVEAYDLCARRSTLSGGKWHVDHVIPLIGKTVCGLHIAANVAVVPAAYNLAKSNKLIA